MKRSILLVCVILQQSCNFGQFNKIYSEYDHVKSVKRIWKEFYYSHSVEQKTPIYNVKQSIFKEIYTSGQVIYTVYDKIALPVDSYEIKEKVYLIIDEKVFPINASDYETYNKSSISEDTKTILTADSSRVEVVTGYTQYSRKYVKFNYILSPEIIENINNSHSMHLRYYVGPRMITYELDRDDLRKLKILVNMS